jgi:threonine aldolase
LTSLVCIENTTNKGGGACWDFAELQKIRKVCDEHHLKYHLDGARLWNALVAKKEDPKRYGALFDTISVCLSKGMGCPVGSVLVGDSETIAKALRVRKVLGGGMRQAGFLAAAGIYAMDNHIDRLADDHKKAAEIGKVLSKLGFIKKVEPIETNIIIFELDESQISSSDFLKKLEENQISIIGMGQGKLRIVTHLDYTDAMHDHFLTILKKIG